MLTRSRSSMPAMLNRLPPYSGISESTTSTRAPSVDQPMREVAADEPEAAGDHHAAISVEGAVVERRRVVAAAVTRAIRIAERLGRPSPRTISCSHSFSRSRRSRRYGRTLKNCDAPALRAIVVDRDLAELRHPASLQSCIISRQIDPLSAAQLDAIEDHAADQAEVAVDVAHPQPERPAHRRNWWTLPMIDAVQRIRRGHLDAVDEVACRR